ncbi:MAG: twin-arginine translocation signal domain-containing protein [Xanthobacteraceae bacterium]
MTILNSPGAFQSCACCAPRGVSRRQFLCTSAAAVAAAPTLAAVVSPAAAQQPSTAVAPRASDPDQERLRRQSRSCSWRFRAGGRPRARQQDRRNSPEY